MFKTAKKSLFFIIIILLTASCKKQVATEKIESPLGFIEYSKKIQSNKKKNLFFFHLHHCPNCTLVQNHLINTKAFQEATKEYNRYYLELGRPLGKELMKKYSIGGAPVFVLADKDFKHLSTSQYGLLSLTGFKTWLSTGKISPPAGEIAAIKKISDKYDLKKAPKYKGIYQLFSKLENEEKTALNWSEFLNYSHSTLLNWSNAKFLDSDKFANHYRIGLGYMKLASLAKKKDKTKYHSFLKECIKQFEHINSDSLQADYGSYIFQIYSYIELGDDKKVNELTKLMEKANPNNRTLLYHSLAYGYLTYRGDCKKVFEYTNKLSLDQIPVQTDRIYQAFYRAQCYKKENNLKTLKEEYTELLKSLDDDLESAFPDRIKKIKGMIAELESKTKQSSFLTQPEIQCTVLEVEKESKLFGINIKQYDSISNDAVRSKLTISNKSVPLTPELKEKTVDFEKIEITKNDQRVILKIHGKPISRNGTLELNGERIAKITCH